MVYARDVKQREREQENGRDAFKRCVAVPALSNRLNVTYLISVAQQQEMIKADFNL